MAIEIDQQVSTTTSTSSCVKLSNVANSDAHGEDSPYFAGWKAYDENPYDEITNPSGVIQMGLAENQVSFDLLEEYLENNADKQPTARKSSGISSFRENALFQDYHGLQSFRQAMDGFMGKIRSDKVKFDPERVVLTSGATAANELLTFILANPGDALLVPTPYYPGFDRDLRWRTGVKIVPVHCNSSNNFQVTPQALEDAYKEAESMNIKVRGLLLTNPSNPLGIAMERKVLEEILNFITRKNIHLVSDEIYSGSVFSSTEFVSVAEILEARNYKDAERVHIVYSLSKDLGLPGFRVGTIYSYNDKVVTTARRMSSFSLVSSQTQNLLAAMLSDPKKIEEKISANYDGLRKAGIECLEGNAGLFCWMNLSPFLKSSTIESELILWNCMVNEVKLNIAPGSSCHCDEPGWFRVCFANMSEETLQVVLKRIYKFMETHRKEA
ncbi:hypothetical protein MKW98_010498 [Papaver atlanticum]|uniref:Aminotransferase class I/classII large domain-containing protein n=1 Tax=Papaver atlanticum TaxID=357466 RepID=A0AAD4S0I5_9MAGN|nr:hypothetical protein MKW98_010498 [Papaver atlanticum]